MMVKLEVRKLLPGGLQITLLCLPHFKLEVFLRTISRAQLLHTADKRGDLKCRTKGHDDL